MCGQNYGTNKGRRQCKNSSLFEKTLLRI